MLFLFKKKNANANANTGPTTDFKSNNVGLLETRISFNEHRIFSLSKKSFHF